MLTIGDYYGVLFPVINHFLLPPFYQFFYGYVYAGGFWNAIGSMFMYVDNLSNLFVKIFMHWA